MIIKIIVLVLLAPVLISLGASNADKNRSRGLMTPGKFRLLENNYRQLGYEQGKFIASYEVVYGHAWLP